MSTKLSKEEQEVIAGLQANWVWVADWQDSSAENTAGRLVTFTKSFSLDSAPGEALVHFTADTRYKLYVNGKRLAIGPVRSSPMLWYYDTLDIASYLEQGENEIKFVVIRYFIATRSAMPFERTAFPGFTVFGQVKASSEIIDLCSKEGWKASVDNSILFPTGLPDDVFLHINERKTPDAQHETAIKPYNMKTLNGDIAPWRLAPRCIPRQVEEPVSVDTVRSCKSSLSAAQWEVYLSGSSAITLPADSLHVLDIQAEVHSTAFLTWKFAAAQDAQIKLKVMYSEGYELEPRSYPFFRTKADRLDAEHGFLIGPFDEVTLNIPAKQQVTYEPFWFRTFRLMRFEIRALSGAVELHSFQATQTNYPLAVKASWHEAKATDNDKIWDVSIRTMRNCMFDGYSDCPFYEQLQYSGDSRSVGMFHYLLSGDDRLMRQAITNFAASIIPSGLTQSRFPSHVKQTVAGFSLYWILSVCDHHLFFGEPTYTRSFLPRIDGVLEFFSDHIDERGLISGLPDETWQYVDWVTSWGATETHPDKGVPTSGRKSNCHTFFSMLYAYTLTQTALLLKVVGRPGHASEYEIRAASLLEAVRTHCYDGQYFTDSTANVAQDDAYSQHCQVFAILSGAAKPEDYARLLKVSFNNQRFSKCSYVMMFYAFRAFSKAGDDVYESFWQKAWEPWHRMLANNLSTWEEDDVRQRSDCHAWGSVPIHEYCTELAGIRPIAPGCSKVMFKPRLALSEELEAKVALGKDNIGSVTWKTGAGGRRTVSLHLTKAVAVVSILPGGQEKKHGVTDKLELIF